MLAIYMINHWQGFLRDFVEFPSLETAKIQLEKALNNLLYLHLF